MKRGFLKNPRPKNGVKSPPNKSDRADHADHNQASSTPQKPPCPKPEPAPPLDLHKPPPSLQGSTSDGLGRNRFVFRKWPRNPKGPPLLPTPNRAKEASNGIDLWGATLYDFYRVRRLPDCPNYETTSTGSRLAMAMREMGELDWAKDEIHWADHNEEEPHEVFPCDVGQLIRDAEYFAHLGARSNSTRKKGKGNQGAETTENCIPDLLPFSTLRPAPKLQRRIPFHLLPRKLIVHDPWNLLSVSDSGDPSSSEEAKKTKATNKPDIVRSYCLHLSDDGKKTVEQEEKARAEKEAKESNQKLCIPIQFTPETLGTDRDGPLITAYCPVRPSPQKIPEAHLYLSPSARAGEGNHSVVYNAEWELPRSFLIEDEFCNTCLLEKVHPEMQEMEKRGAIIPDNFSPDVNLRSQLESAGTIQGDSSATAPILEVESPSVVGEVTTAGTMELVMSGEESGEVFTIKVKEPRVYQTQKYEGKVVTLHPDVHWQNSSSPTCCSHLRPKPDAVPLTSKVTVAAKLSFQHDRHLGREAKNYQSFPAHFFEHFNGYNVVPPIHDPVPVGALVPQFYGYYVPDSSNFDQKSPPYLSPILLMEDCGVPIRPESLSKDDRNECASLLFRFHHAGWFHNSFAERNILMQGGPLTEWPLYRMVSDIRSFRLIDFGRSTKDDPARRPRERAEAEQLLGLGIYENFGN